MLVRTFCFILVLLFSVISLSDFVYMKEDYFQRIYEFLQGQGSDISKEDFEKIIQGYFDSVVDLMLMEVNQGPFIHISLEMIISLGIKETNFRNIVGDGGKSVGIFQIQYSTYKWTVEILTNVYNFDSLPFLTESEYYDVFLKDVYLQSKTVFFVLYFIGKYVIQCEDWEKILNYYNTGQILNEWEYGKDVKRIRVMIEKIIPNGERKRNENINF